LTRVYESNGPEVKIRGTAHHIAEKYLQLARDAQTSGDPITAENHHQHAEHYFRLIAAAQEQFRQQNPYYQPPPAPGEGNRDDAFDDGDDDMGQPTQQPMHQGQPLPAQPNFGNQQPPYPQPRPQQQQPQQQQPQQQQPQYQHNPQTMNAEASDGERLPSFITGAQPQPGPQNFSQNGHDNQGGGGERFPRHRRRRHRSGRPDMPADMRDDGSDDSRPGNS
jgi:hypothetical protein